MKILFSIVMMAAFAFLLGACSSCEEKDDETLIRQLFTYAVETAERHDVGDLMDITADDFKVTGHGADRREVKGILLMAFRRYGNFSISHPSPDVEIGADGVSAVTQTPFLIIREGNQAPELEELYDDPREWLARVGEMADLYNIKLWLVKTAEGWRVNKADLDGYRRLEDL